MMVKLETFAEAVDTTVAISVVEGGTPRIEKYRVSGEAELAVPSGESGSVAPKATIGTVSVAATAVNSVFEARPPGIAK